MGYLELSKRRLNPGENPSAEALADQRVAKQVLAKVISQMHLMLHPLMPHLTEELWHSVTGEPETTFLALQPWPALDESALDDALEASFAELIAAIRVVRNLRAVAGLKPSQTVPVRFVSGRGDLVDVLQQGMGDIPALTKAETVQVMTPS